MKVKNGIIFAMADKIQVLFWSLPALTCHLPPAPAIYAGITGRDYTRFAIMLYTLPASINPGIYTRMQVLPAHSYNEEAGGSI
jgi:hypothetical protein